jgi:hypothetical protein
MAAMWRIERDVNGRCADLVLMARVEDMAVIRRGKVTP